MYKPKCMRDVGIKGWVTAASEIGTKVDSDVQNLAPHHTKAIARGLETSQKGSVLKPGY